MESMGKINITAKDFEKIKNRKIGEGQDAVVYKGKNNILYKVYKDETNLKDNRGAIKIYKKGSWPKTESRICYIDKDGVKIYYRDAFKRIINRQKDIKLSKLPRGSLYINGKFSGCVLQRIYGMQLHYVFPLLSRKNKLRVLKEIIQIIKELTDNYVYPVDTDNSPFAGKHSNILVDYKLKPRLIDLDGNSTVYRECYDENMYRETLTALNLLFVELLQGNVYGQNIDELDIEMIKDRLVLEGLSIEEARRLSTYEGNYDDLNNMVQCYLKK